MKHFSKRPGGIMSTLIMSGLLGLTFSLEGVENLSKEEEVAHMSGIRGEARPASNIGSLRHEGLGLGQASVVFNQLLLQEEVYEAVHIVTYARAQIRLLSEMHPLVQITLLAALRTND